MSPALLLVLVLTSPLPAGEEPAGPVAGPSGPSRPAQPEPKLTDPFNLFLSTTIRGGLSVGATCINYQPPSTGGPTGGRITISDLPPLATVHRAYLYFSVLSDSFPVMPGLPTFEGNMLLPVPLGTVFRSPCFPQTNTGTFRADVTPWVTGNGTYSLAGFPGTGQDDGDLTEGATLYVLYCDPVSPLRDVVIWEGVDCLNENELNFSQQITGFAADPVGPVSAYLGVAAGNGQNAEPDPFLFNGTNLDALYPEILSGGACPGMFYDRTAYDVSPYVAPGSALASLSVTLSVDCYTFASIALAVSTDQTRPDDACLTGGCGGSLTVSDDPITVCEGETVDVTLLPVFAGCPPGPSEEAVQLTDPITARNDVSSSDLDPALAAASAAQATLIIDLTGDTDLTACVEVALIDPAGTPHVVKDFGVPDVNPHDVTAFYTGPGLYQVRLTEASGCGADANRFATLSGSRLTVVEQTGTAPVEHQVVDTSAVEVCPWSDNPLCSFQPRVCPGSETLIARARCTFDPGCVASRAFEVRCDVGPTEPSAMDIAPPGTEPLRVAKDAGQLLVTWEDLGAGPTYHLYRGTIGSYYDHGSLGACALAAPSYLVPSEPGGHYFLATATGCWGTTESSYGRNWLGAERPDADMASGRPCP